jgi:hypothetical protein
MDDVDVPGKASPAPAGSYVLLWQGDRLAAGALFAADALEAASTAQELASRLAGEGAVQGGVDLVAASLAVAKVQESALAALLAELVRKKDLEPAVKVGRLLKMATDRLARLGEIHSGLIAHPQRVLHVHAVAYRDYGSARECPPVEQREFNFGAGGA